MQPRTEARSHISPGPLSGTPSTSSSQPLQTSIAARQASNPLQSARQSRFPAVPQAVVHAIEEPCRQARPSSAVPSPSSSQLLQVSAAAKQVEGSVQVALQVRLPEVP